MMNDKTPKNRTALDCPTIVAGVKGGVCLSADGEIEYLKRDYLSLKASEYAIVSQPILVCHGPTVISRLGLDKMVALDILELWAFVRPAQFCVPTVAGICRELSLPAPDSLEDTAIKTRQIAEILLGELRNVKNKGKENQGGPSENFANLCRIAATMAKAGWVWSNAVMGALGITIGQYKDAPLTSGLDVWNRLPEWEELPPTDTPGHTPVSEDDAGGRLLSLLGDYEAEGGAEIRQGQMDYARGLAVAFQAGTPIYDSMTENQNSIPPNTPPIALHPTANDNGADSMTPDRVIPPLVLAEAGTGVGKTLGYIAPASVWTENNDAPVWISTYTRNLQHQIDSELDKLYPNPQQKYNHVVVRKGRENYLCLGRFEWAVRRGATVNPQSLIALGLIARWLEHTRDGDLNGSDFPSWLTDLMDPKHQIFYNLVVRYDDGGSHADCNHNKKCFVDMVVKRSMTADLVIVNHALVLSQSKLGSLAGQTTAQTTGNGINGIDEEDSTIPHIIFDEGHHLFTATDSAYTIALTAKEGERLRNFIAPKESDFFDSPDSNLKQLIGDAIADDSDGLQALDDLINGTHFLVQDGWYKRLENGNPKGTMEWFLYHVGRVVYTRDENRGGSYSLECETAHAPQDMVQAGIRYLDDLRHVERPALQLATSLEMKLANEGPHLDTHVRRSLRQAAGQLRTRVVGPLLCWRTMISDLMGETEQLDGVVDRFMVFRKGGRDFDVGMVRSLVDPMHYFNTGVVQQSRGVAITSATLTDGRGYEDEHWHWALQRTGATHHPTPATRLRVPSPFDYPKQTRIYIIDDVETRNMAEVAGAFRSLFSASNGGALGLFTAIERLGKVYETIAPVMEDIDIPLYAQHVDKLSLPTLLDMFRAETNSCLLGTDAVRDGVDVPGDSLRMIVFERVPWTRPDILHKARRKHFGAGYDDALVSARLKQAFGRLIRRGTDRGVFVMLQPLPSRFHNAFPEGVEIIKQGLSDTLKDISEFLDSKA